MVIGYPRWLDAQDKQSVHGKRTPERHQAGDSIPQPSAFTIGGMALVQCLKGDQKTFAAVPETVLRKVLNEGGTSDRVDVIFDDYREESVKNAEQENRGEGSGSEYCNIQADHKIKQWEKFRCNSKNKQAFIVFCYQHMEERQVHGETVRKDTGCHVWLHMLPIITWSNAAYQ